MTPRLTFSNTVKGSVRITNPDVRSSDKSVGKDCTPNKPTGASHVSQASNLCQQKKSF